jgi:hypothetical protein
LGDHDVETARFAGLGALIDSALLSAMEGRFDTLVTCDQNLRWQQNLQGRNLSIIVLIAASNRLADLAPLAPRVNDTSGAIMPGQIIELENQA